MTTAGAQPALRGLALAGALGAAVAGGAAAASVPLREEAHINSELLAAQVGDILRKTCPDASARLWEFWSRVRALEAYARAQGYTEAEVEAFLDDRAEKRRIRLAAEEYLAQAGAVKGDPESYCRVARDEVARGTPAGTLLRVTR